MTLSRRNFLQASISASALSAFPFAAHAIPSPYILTAGKARTQILPKKYGKTDVWAFNNQVSGPVLRVKQGDLFHARFENKLDVPSSIHWHGVRVPNNMDGVPFITQAPVAPQASFDYAFRPQDAGTFWYHPHLNSAEQVGRGLSGVLIVEEDSPIDVDQDISFVLDDWRLGEDGKIIEDFPNLHDRAHGGRFGNVTGVNGQYKPNFDVQNGERLRLRLINSANARIFSPEIPGQSVWVIAFDGQPITPLKLEKQNLRLGPGMRADLIVDVHKTDETSVIMIDRTYPGDPIQLAHFDVSGKGTPRISNPPILPANPLSVPDLANAEHRAVVYEGGAMGRMTSAKLNGASDTAMRDLVQKSGVIWASNGNTYTSLDDLNKAKRLFQLKLGKSYIFSLSNKTSFQHPIHLHGHTYQLIARNGKKLKTPMWQDTVLISPNETVEIAFVADNPGHWMFHCHILDHAAAGMA